MQKSTVADSTTGQSKDSRLAYFSCMFMLENFLSGPKFLSVMHLNYLGFVQAQACFSIGDKIR